MQPDSQTLTTETVAWIGAVTGIIGMLSGLIALVWDVFKWKIAEHPKIKALIRWHMTLRKGGVDKELEITIENLGVRPTTITRIWLTNGGYGRLGFPKKPTREYGGLVFDKEFDISIPFVLNPGERWVGNIDLNDENTSNFMKLSNTYLLITHTLAKKALAIKLTKNLKDSFEMKTNGKQLPT